LKPFSKREQSLLKLLFGLLLVGGGIYAFQVTHLSQMLSYQNLIHLVEEARVNRLITLLFYAGFVFGVMALPITIFPIVGGVLLPFWLAVPLNILAATLGAFLSFCVSRYFGRGAVENFLKGKFKAFDHKAIANGFKTVLILRLIGIPPFIVTNYALGLSPIRVRDFIFATILGIFPWMTLVTVLASHLWEAILVGGEKGFMHALMTQMRPLFGLTLLILVVFAINYFLKKKNKLQPAKQHHSNL
jgi:uncharacterized membrane protein YdjX (TVP38/TMEM64 family)